MQYLFHTDFLVDCINNPGGQNQTVVEKCRAGELSGWVLSSSIPALYEAVRSSKGVDEAKHEVGEILKVFSTLNPTASDLAASLASSNGTDMGVLLAAKLAKDFGLEGIVAKSPEAFSSQDVKALSIDGLFEDLTAHRPVSGVPLLDVSASYPEVWNKVESEMADVMRSGRFILGSKVSELEEKIADYCQSKYAVGVSSGTDALLISLMAADIRARDEVITSPYTFFATGGAVARLGAVPVFVDIDEASFNLDPALIEARITEKTRAIIPVHLYGQCADMDPILDVARRHNLVVIEDAAQAIGSEYKNRRAGSMGDYGCFSFFPTKNLGGFGDGGIVTTSSKENYDRLVSLRVHGSKPKYYHKVVGGNFRLDPIQAAVVSAKLDRLEGWTAKRRQNAATYTDLIEKNDLASLVRPPAEVFPRHIYNQYVVRVGARRDELKDYLAGKKVATEIYYPLPLHLQECFAGLGYKEGDLSVSEKAANETLALPISQEVSKDQQEYVVQSMKAFLA